MNRDPRVRFIAVKVTQRKRHFEAVAQRAERRSVSNEQILPTVAVKLGGDGFERDLRPDAGGVPASDGDPVTQRALFQL